MSHIRTLSQMLLCQLTEEELKQESRKLTDLLLEKSRIEDAKAAAAKYYSEEVDIGFFRQRNIIQDPIQPSPDQQSKYLDERWLS